MVQGSIMSIKPVSMLMNPAIHSTHSQVYATLVSTKVTLLLIKSVLEVRVHLSVKEQTASRKTVQLFTVTAPARLAFCQLMKL